ncbi:hypothetical protein FRB95_010698 [Tulasnella sp. JGI-2019a]|nr:hypothetical protein FRB95_010698 [Tulasnella sp. JGI-2019a]
MPGNIIAARLDRKTLRFISLHSSTKLQCLSTGPFVMEWDIQHWIRDQQNIYDLDPIRDCQCYSPSFTVDSGVSEYNQVGRCSSAPGFLRAQVHGIRKIKLTICNGEIIDVEVIHALHNFKQPQ